MRNTSILPVRKDGNSTKNSLIKINRIKWYWLFDRVYGHTGAQSRYTKLTYWRIDKQQVRSSIPYIVPLWGLSISVECRGALILIKSLPNWFFVRVKLLLQFWDVFGVNNRKNDRQKITQLASIDWRRELK